MKHPSVKLASKAFEALSHVFYSTTYNYADQLLQLCKEEERGHRGFMDGFNRAHTDDTATVSEAAKLFAVKRIADYLLGDKYPSGQDYLHIQRSCFIAAGIADEFGAQVREAWKGFELRQLSALDYCDIVKVRRETHTEENLVPMPG